MLGWWRGVGVVEGILLSPGRGLGRWLYPFSRTKKKHFFRLKWRVLVLKIMKRDKIWRDNICISVPTLNYSELVPPLPRDLRVCMGKLNRIHASSYEILAARIWKRTPSSDVVCCFTKPHKSYRRYRQTHPLLAKRDNDYLKLLRSGTSRRQAKLNV